MNAKRPRVVGLITARGGSSLKGKNIARVGGKPLIAWTIEAARASRTLDAVVVSTDDAEIAAVARRLGADVPFIRPAALARANTPHLPVVEHALRWLETHRGWKPEYLMLLQPTSPLRIAADIDAVARLAFRTDADAVVSVGPADPHPFVCVRASRGGFLAPFVPGARLDLRRQDFPEAYAMNGAIYLTKRRVLLGRKTFYPKRTRAFVMPAERSLDIDGAGDMRLADLALRERAR